MKVFTMLNPILFSIAVSVAFLTFSCGADLNSDRDDNAGLLAESAARPVAGNCRIREAGEDQERASTRIFRHKSAEGTLKLSISDLPITCAETYSIKPIWEQDQPALTLNITGDRYKHCLCDVDFEPFDMDVPASIGNRLNSAILSLVHGDSPVDLVSPVVIGEIPFIDQH